jgi:hypothetical protein
MRPSVRHCLGVVAVSLIGASPALIVLAAFIFEGRFW